MRKLLLSLLISISGLIYAGEGERTVIDIKVPLAESTDLLPAQLGASVFLMQSEWARVSEIGEDAAVWLRDYDRKKNLIRQQVLSLTLEIREPSTLRTGNLIAEERIVVRYWPSDHSSENSRHQIVNDLEQLSNELKEEAYFLGNEIESVLKQHFK